MLFSIRSLLILMAVAAVFTQPAYEYSVSLYEQWNAAPPTAPPDPALKSVKIRLPVLRAPTTNTVVCPDGGTVIIGGIIIRPDRPKWVQGKLVPPQKQ